MMWVALYLFRAGNPSIYAHKLERDGTIHEAHELFGTSMGHWTEGPGVFKRAGRYYITMTGNHLLSRGYTLIMQSARMDRSVHGWFQEIRLYWLILIMKTAVLVIHQV